MTSQKEGTLYGLAQNLPRLAPFSGGMKFTTQISPLLSDSRSHQVRPNPGEDTRKKGKMVKLKKITFT